MIYLAETNEHRNFARIAAGVHFQTIGKLLGMRQINVEENSGERRVFIRQLRKEHFYILVSISPLGVEHRNIFCGGHIYFKGASCLSPSNTSVWNDRVL